MQPDFKFEARQGVALGSLSSSLKCDSEFKRANHHKPNKTNDLIPNKSLKRTEVSVDHIACRRGAASNVIAPSAQAPNAPSA